MGGIGCSLLMSQPYNEPTLEVLSSIKVAKQCSFTHQVSLISFRAFGMKHWVTQDHLHVLLWLYMETYTYIPKFEALRQDFLYPMTSETYWTSIATSSRTKKASQILNPTHLYMHALFTRGIRGWLDLTGVVSCANILMLYSIIEHYPLHMENLITEVLAHQGQFVHLQTIFVGPYITQMIRGMGLSGRM